ncbi:MAG TPA: T9SS type A sorting domain-containing protein, partial [Candidatus Kapabacteria bacterium]|nr:T9SS type A sorting domain-containing protein [Candidatus Kapabacteria bacterium]
PDITDPSTPTSLSSTYTPSAWSNVSSVTMNWAASSDTWSGVAGYSYVWNHSATTPTDSTVKTSSTSYTTPLGDAGDWYFHVRALDNAGNPSSDTIFGPVRIDATPPTTPSIITSSPSANQWTNNPAVFLTWKATDATSGLEGYVTAIDTSAATIINAGVPNATTSLSTNLGNGKWFVHIAAEDSAGNWSATTTYGPIKMDTTAPKLPVVITLQPAPRVWTHNDTLQVTWRDTDALSGINGYSYAIDTLPGTVPNGGLWFTNSVIQPLTDGRSWYFHLRSIDSAGNWSQVLTEGPFFINSTPPSAPVILFSSLTPSVWTSKNIDSIRWKYSASSAGLSGPLGYSWQWDHSPHTVPDTIILGAADSAVSTPFADGNWYFHLRAVDSADNWSPAVDLGPFMIDRTPPTGTLMINNGASQTASLLVTINVTATDAESGPAQMQFSNDTVTWSVLQPYQRTVTNWDLHLYGGNDSGGIKKVYGRVLDNAGNASPIFGNTIAYVPLSVQEPAAPSQFALAVYPNPASTTATLHWSAAPPGATIYITDMLGRRTTATITSVHSETTATIDMNTLHSGVYMVHLVSSAGTASTELMVVK